MRIEWMLLGFGLLLSACSDGDGDGDGSGDGTGTGTGDDVAIEDRPLSGLVGGSSWTVARAETDAFLSEGEPDYWVDLYAEGGVACETSSLDSGHHLIVQVPRAPGEYRLSLSNTATFVIVGEEFENLATTTGRIVVDSVDATTIRGGAYLRFDADNTVNGRFEVTICPDG